MGTRDGGLSLYDTSSRRRLVALAGHTAAGGASPCGAAFTPDGRFCMSVATGDRSVAIWRVPASGEGGASNGKSGKAAGGRAVPAMLRLALPDSWPVQVTCAAAGDGESSHLLAVVVSHAGEAFVWRCKCSGTGENAELTVSSAAPVRIHVGAHAAPGKQAGGDGVLTAQARVESAQGARWCREISHPPSAPPHTVCTVLFSVPMPKHMPRPGTRNAVPQPTPAPQGSGPPGGLLASEAGLHSCVPVCQPHVHTHPGRRYTYLTHWRLTHGCPSPSGDASLLVSYGNTARPHFTRLPLPADGGEDTLVIGGSAHEDEAAAGGRRGARGGAASGAAVAVLGGDNAADAAMHRPKPASLRHGTPGASLAGGANGGDVAMGDAGSGELTLGERLRALELAAGTAAAAFRAAPAGAGEEVMDADRADGEAGAAGGADASHWRRVVTSLDAGTSPRADSLVILLTQALGSSDGALLERVLSVSQASVVSNTCNLLSPQLALSFLAACVARLQAKPVRGAHLARWIRALLVAHAAHFANSPLAGTLLASLYGILDTRLALYRPLLALSGRLDLVLAAHARGKATSQANGEDGDDDGAANHLPVVYDEPDGAEVEVEDARGGVGDSDDDASDGDDADEGEEGEDDGAGDDSDAWETDDDADV